MQDYRLKLGLPVSIASTALILVWIFLLSQSRALWHRSLRLSGTFHPGGPAQYTACGILPPAGNGFQVSASAVLRSPEPVRDLSVAYAHHHDPAGQFSMVQYHEQQRFWLFLPCMVVITCVFGYFATRFIDHPASAKKKG